MQPTFPFRVSYKCGQTAATLPLDLTIYYCQEANKALCRLEEGDIKITLQPDEGAPRGPFSIACGVSAAPVQVDR